MKCPKTVVLLVMMMVFDRAMRGSTQREALAPAALKKPRAYNSHCNPPNIGAKLILLMRAFKRYII